VGIDLYRLLVELVRKEIRYALGERIHGNSRGPQDKIRRDVMIDKLAVRCTSRVYDVVLVYGFDSGISGIDGGEGVSISVLTGHL
jgi:hypothetical protein